MLLEDVSGAFDIFSLGGDLESCGGLELSDCELEALVDVSVVPGVTDVPVSPPSVVTVFCDGFFVLLYLGICGTAALFSGKRAHSWTVMQEEMRFEAQSSRRMMPPTPLQNSYSSFEEEQRHFEVEDQIWSARDRTVIARTKQFLEESKKFEGGSWRAGIFAGSREFGCGFQTNLGRSNEQKGLRNI